MNPTNREKRKAALAQVRVMGEGRVIPAKPMKVSQAQAEDLEATVEQGYLAQTVGELLEKARQSRGLGKRELARRLESTHSRVSKMEGSENVELKSLLKVAGTLGYDVSISLIPREGGAALGAVVKKEEARV